MPKGGRRDSQFRVTTAIAIVAIIVPSAIALYQYYHPRTIAASLSASIAPSSASGPAPLLESFSSSVTGGAPPFNYSWQFGDGSHSYESTPTHVYNTTGEFRVQLWVRDSGGSEAPAGATVLVTVGSALTVYISGPGNITTSSPAAFTADVGGGTPPYTYTWEFGNGSYVTTNANPTFHSFSTAGQFRVNVTVHDANDAEAASNGLLVNVSSPSPSLAAPALPYAEIAVGVVVIMILMLALLGRRRRRVPPPAPASMVDSDRGHADDPARRVPTDRK